MSWKTINQILGLASIDPEFRQTLQVDPISAAEAQGVELTREEQEVFKELSPLNFPEFCQRLLERLAPYRPDENC
jgi:hypothetical protein